MANRKSLQASVATLNEVLNRPKDAWVEVQLYDQASYKACVGHLFLDHNSAYGGYSLREMRDHGGEKDLSGRLSAKEMESFLHGILTGLRLSQKTHA